MRKVYRSQTFPVGFRNWGFHPRRAVLHSNKTVSKRYTHLLAILLLFGLGSGFSQALHNAVAHSGPATGQSCCHSTCSSLAKVSPSQDDAPPTSPSSDTSHCPVCLTIASAKTSVPVLQTCVIAPAPLVEFIAPLETQAPRPVVLRVKRSRAPPVV